MPRTLFNAMSDMPFTFLLPQAIVLRTVAAPDAISMPDPPADFFVVQSTTVQFSTVTDPPR